MDQLRTALLVDDDPLVCQIVGDMLEELGFSVTAVQSAAAAFQALRTIDHLDLLVTDVLMPGMDGWTLAEKVREGIPEVPVLYATGFVGDFSRPVESGRVILKPFGYKEFARALLDLLASTSGNRPC